MRKLFYIIFILLKALNADAQSVFDTATCGGINKLNGYGADKIFAKSKEWITQNLQPLNYTENETNGSIIITSMEDYNARAADKLPQHYSGKFEYTFQVNAKDGYYSYDFVNVKYIPAAKVNEAITDPDKSDHKPVRIKQKTWEKISRSAFRQLQEKGKAYDAFMQKC